MKPENSLLTKCVHAGRFKDNAVGSIVTPIYTGSSYSMKSDSDEVCYPRYFNPPTQKAASEKIAALENGPAGLVLSSGMAAIVGTLFTLLQSGDHAVVHRDIYGGSYHFVTSEFDRLGINYTLVKGDSLDEFAGAIQPDTRLVYFETPTNPLLKVVDMAGLAELAKSRNVMTVMDNTFASPINQNPLDFGVDVVVHSGTKYLGGHSDLLCGAVVTTRELKDKISHTATNFGGVLGAFEASQLERSMKTLGLRIRQHNRNGQALAEFLNEHPKVKKVYYPGLPDHPGHNIAKSQMRGFGGMLSADIEGDHRSVREMVEKLELFSHAVSLGGVESLICFPVLTSHAKMPAAEREKLGITDTLIRISVGIEDTEDLIADFKAVLN